MPTVATLSAAVDELRAEVAQLKEQLDGVRVIKQRRPQPEGEPCVLGNDPTYCEKASVYRYQKGCKGLSCLDKNSEYYAKNRDKKAEAKNGTKVEAPKRKPAAAKKAAPAKKASPKALGPKSLSPTQLATAERLLKTAKPIPTKRVAKT